jgi:hypothetical protein
MVQEEGVNQISNRRFSTCNTRIGSSYLCYSSGRLLEECLRYFHVHWSEQGFCRLLYRNAGLLDYLTMTL